MAYYSPFDLLPRALIALIISYLQTDEKFRVAPLVCREWWEICRSDPLVWQIMNFSEWESGPGHVHLYDVVPRLAQHARSSVRKLDLDFMDYDMLAEVLTGCKCSLEWLRVGNSDMTDEWAQTYAPMLRKLKHLELSECYDLTRVGVIALGRGCPSLTHLCLRDLCLADEDIPHNINRSLIPMPNVDVVNQSNELLLILTILKKCTRLESLTFVGTWTDFDVKHLSDKTARASLVKDVRKKYNSLCKARRPPSIRMITRRT